VEQAATLKGSRNSHRCEVWRDGMAARVAKAELKHMALEVAEV